MSGRRRYRTRWAAWLVIAAAFGCACTAVAIRGGAVEWFLMILTASLAVLSGLLPFLAMRSISVSRALPEADISAGDRLAIRITLHRRWRIPMVWFALEDLLNNDCGLEEKSVSLRAVFSPMFAGEMTVRYDLYGLDRGLYALSSVTVTCGDLFGLTCARRELPLHSELAVTPEWSSDNVLGEASASNASPSVPALSEFRNGQLLREPGTDGTPMNRSGSGPDTRAYRAGDSIRHLDFRAAARGRGLYTKVYAGESYKEWHLAIDQYAVPYNGDSGLFDASISLALGTVMRASDEGNLVTLHTGDWSYELSGSTEKEQDHGLQELRRRLAYLRPSAEQVDGRINLDGGAVVPFRDKMLRMISADWQDTERWRRLFEQMGSQGIRLELYLLTRNAVLSFAMREQARQLEERGIAVYWMHVAQSKEARAAAGEGVKAYALG